VFVASGALLVPATGGTVAPMPEIPTEYRGWWRIVETSQWVNDDIDICGTATRSGMSDASDPVSIIAQ